MDRILRIVVAGNDCMFLVVSYHKVKTNLFVSEYASKLWNVDDYLLIQAKQESVCDRKKEHNKSYIYTTHVRLCKKR